MIINAAGVLEAIGGRPGLHIVGAQTICYRVKYVHRGKKATPGWETGQWRWASKSAFTDDVDQEVACDWDPDFTS